MLRIMDHQDSIIELRHEGHWDSGDLNLYRKAIAAIMKKQDDATCYLILNFTATTHVNPNLISDFLANTIVKNPNIGMTVIVSERPLSRFIQQIIQLMTLRDPMLPLRMVDNIEEGIVELSTRKLAAGSRARKPVMV